MIEASFNKYKEIVDMHLVDLLPDVDHKSITVYESMKYSLTAGGKRVRPCLLIAACEFCGGDIKTALPYACAIEYVHTYSLIHDDLPCMDDDELRRGLKTNHMVYGEAIATLAGDGLLTTAFEAMSKDMFLYFDDDKELKKRARAAYEIAKGAGCSGMLAGQVADIENEGKACSGEMLDYIHINKTAALITAAVRAGAQLGGADDKTITDLTEYAENLGLAFQIADDILDIVGDEEIMGKKAGVDAGKKKATYPGLYGIEKSYERLKQLTDNALDSIADYYDNAEFFADLVRELSERTK
ncbi:MAG: farnesyl diphosphate synthase [Eubacteriaceae bacterium]|nr:farnesyl diphosphate synthase [Eubacteriaceae bacterium]